MRLFKASKGLIGIDITSTAIKLLELKKSHDTYQVESHAVCSLRDGAVAERRIQDINYVTDSLKRAIDHAKPTTRNAVVALPASMAITKVLTFAAGLNEQEIEERLMIESDRHLPFPFNDVAFDFACLGPAPSAAHLQQVMLVACRQQDVWQLTEPLVRAGLEPVAVDVETFAIERAFAALRPQLPTPYDPAASVALVDIGAQTSTFRVFHNARTVYVRENLQGSEPLTAATQERYALSREDALWARQHGGLPDYFQDVVLKPFLDAFAQSIARALQLYIATSRQSLVGHIVLAGDINALPGLATFMADACQLPVTLLNPLQTMPVNRRVDRQALTLNLPGLLTASGLAMRAPL